MRQLTHGSLFAGIGGFDLGFERAGIKTVWQVEIDPFCRRVLERHFPGARRFGDIKDVHGGVEAICWNNRPFRECSDCLPRVDILTGGDPCQDNSNACRHSPALKASIGDQFIRIVEELRPRIVVRENPSTARADAPWPWYRFRQELERYGYVVLPLRFRACCIGADIRRDRLFLLAELPQSECAGLEGHEREILAGEKEGRHDAHAAGSDRWSAAPRICGRVTRIPKRMDRLRGLGNAVVPQIAEWIGKRILESVR